MVQATLRAYPSNPNPLLLRSATEHETSTIQRVDREPLEGKDTWPDFDFDEILSLFRAVLDHPFDLASRPTILPPQLRVRDERSFESVLLSYNCIIVNTALKAATDFMGLPTVTWLVGSYAEQISHPQTTFPDWAGISEENPTRSIVPGDSKFTRRAFVISEEDPTKKTSSNVEDSSEDEADISMNSGGTLPSDSFSLDPESWVAVSEACLEQVNHYSKDAASRYCYLVSPYEVVVARRTMEVPMSPSRSLAATRDVRMKNPVPSTPSPYLGSEPPSSPPTDSSMASEYTDSNPQTHMHPIQLRSIPWSNEGPNELTFNLAIWALHILAAIDQEIKSAYPELSEDPIYKSWGRR